MIVRCEEKSGVHLRQVSLMPPSLPAAAGVLSRLREVRSLADGRGYSEALSLLLAPDSQIWLVDDVGIVAVTHIHPDEFAFVHVAFWDKRLRGREGLCQVLAGMVCEEFNLGGLMTALAENRAVPIAFAKRVGFEEHMRHEGFVYLKADASVFAPCKNSVKEA